MNSRTYYYARVSSKEQNLDRQIAAFVALGATDRDIITDKESGKNLDRKGYQALKNAMLRRGDTLVVKSLDRLSRNKLDIHNELQYFKENGIRLKVIDLPTTMMDLPEGQEWVFEMIHNVLIEVLASLAEQGVLCILVEMPFRLAVFDVNAADGISELYPCVESWYIGGHSLGGSMAASYISDHSDEFAGLILLGSYSTADLSATDLDVLSLYGSEDKIMNMDKYVGYKSNLPKDFTEIVIDGGCHAYFGVYGAQDGDGEPSISNEKQIEITSLWDDEKLSVMVTYDERLLEILGSNINK